MFNISKVGRMAAALMLLLILTLNCWQATTTFAQTPTSQFFPETGKTVSGKFLQYWRENGGISVFGFPITEAQNEVNPEDGKTYLTQWFERNRFELHPENAGTKFEVLLGLLGKDLRREALAVDPDFLRAKPLDLINGEYKYFNETGHNLASDFFVYWNANGGVERFGYPISEGREEIDPETGQTFYMQWFERARFELHPENEEPNNVLLGLLGNQLKNPKSKVDFVWKIGGNDDFKNVLMLTLDKQGNFYTTDYEKNLIRKFSNAGQLLDSWGNAGNGDGQFNQPTDVAVDEQGNIYVADSLNYRIQKFNSNRQFLTKWGSEGTANGQFGNAGNAPGAPKGPGRLVVDRQGNVYVIDAANSRVQKFDGNGKFLAKWGEASEDENAEADDEQLDGTWMSDIVVDSQGDCYVVDNEAIKKFDTNGKYLTKWATSERQINYPYGLGIDGQNNLYVTDVDSNVIVKLGSNGQFLLKWGEDGDYNGQFRAPLDVAIDAQGNAFVADRDNKRIQKFRQR